MTSTFYLLVNYTIYRHKFLWSIEHLMTQFEELHPIVTTYAYPRPKRALIRLKTIE